MNFLDVCENEFLEKILYTKKVIIIIQLFRTRLAPTLYIDEISATLPKLKKYRKALIIFPIYCNEKMNRVEI